VDLRRILDFVSPAELERYETEQFRLEAEAEAVALRIKAEDLARRQLQKYARAPNVNKGSRMLNGLGFSVGPTARSRGRPRGNRGKIRGRTRGLDLSPRQLEKDEHAELVDSEPMRFSCPTENMEQRAQTSPTIMRSAFVAHSALSGSPIPRRLSDSVPRQRHSEHSEPEDVADLALSDHHVNSIAGHLPAPTINTRGDDHSKDHPYARLSGMEVTLSSSSSAISSTKMVDVFRKTMPSSDRPSIVASDQDDTISAQLPSQRDELNEQMNDGMMHLHTSHARQHLPEHDNIDNADADSTEEYAVEAIVDHFREHGMNYYVVKWEGYEDSHDWLPEVDLGGAADLVTEYKERIGWENKKVRMR
jgi:hypothetical protein